MTSTQPWQTIPEMVLSAADRFGEAEAVVDGPLRLSYVDLADRIRSAAGAFGEFGVAKGDRVAIWAPNSVEWIIAAIGLLAAGGVLVPVNTRFKAAEAADVLYHLLVLLQGAGIPLQDVMAELERRARLAYYRGAQDASREATGGPMSAEVQ